MVLKLTNIMMVLLLLTAHRAGVGIMPKNKLLTPKQNEEIRKYIDTQNAKKAPIELKKKFGTNLRGLRLISLDLSHTDFSNVDISNAQFIRVNLSYCDLTNATANGSVIQECKLEQSMMSQFQAINADFGASKFIKSEIHNSDFSESNLEDSRFDACNIQNTKFVNVIAKSIHFLNSTIVNSNFQSASISLGKFHRSKTNKQ
ncbi:pentapeptide repeats family protein [Orientia tsutsugamushi str. Gilliam]|uniref:Pentapeptide repeats family protein n=1 Tax=Orientia tsutsugamushi str. Gilliam TaxID=1359184 RepID=A0A0F3MDJ2_ORITS|nr:pentapeptide repeats family protein [Orientia tsutsugamushi str. Gilliam]